MREVFTRLEQAGLKVKTSECKLFTGQVNYLGHVISLKGINPDPEKVAAISQMPVLVFTANLLRISHIS